jgi:hypothetical protein
MASLVRTFFSLLFYLHPSSVLYYLGVIGAISRYLSRWHDERTFFFPPRKHKNRQIGWSVWSLLWKTNFRKPLKRVIHSNNSRREINLKGRAIEDSIKVSFHVVKNTYWGSTAVTFYCSLTHLLYSYIIGRGVYRYSIKRRKNIFFMNCRNVFLSTDKYMKKQINIFSSSSHNDSKEFFIKSTPINRNGIKKCPCLLHF